MEPNESTAQQILACIDGSNVSEAVCDYAAWVANATQCPLTFLHAIEHQQAPPVADLSGAIGLGASEELLNELTDVEQDRSKLLLKRGKLILEGAEARAHNQGVSSIHTLQRHGTIAESVVELEESTSTLVIGIRGHRHDKSNSGVGTHLETVIRSLHRAILVVNNGFKAPKSILLAYNGSEASRKALEMVATSPLFKDLPCHLIYVVPDEKTSGQLLSEAALKLSNAGIKVISAKLVGKIDDALVAYQAEQNIDLMVMGAFSHTRIRGFLLGSFTAKMLERTQTPLLLLR